MVAILDDVLTLVLPTGLIPYAGLVIGGYVVVKVIDFFKKAV